MTYNQTKDQQIIKIPDFYWPLKTKYRLNKGSSTLYTPWSTRNFFADYFIITGRFLMVKGKA